MADSLLPKQDRAGGGKPNEDANEEAEEQPKREGEDETANVKAALPVGDVIRTGDIFGLGLDFRENRPANALLCKRPTTLRVQSSARAATLCLLQNSQT